jgi:hypothetical protein
MALAYNIASLKKPFLLSSDSSSHYVVVFKQFKCTQEIPHLKDIQQ